MTFDSVVEPHLYRDRAEVIAHQTADGDLRLIAADRRGAGDAAARLVRSGLRFEIGYRADLPLADLVDGGEVAEQFVAGDEAVGCSGRQERRSMVTPREAVLMS